MTSASAGRRVRFDGYTIVGWAIYAIAVVYAWRDHVRGHEAIYLLGPRRVADPDFLAGDFTWKTLPPTTFLFDHMLAPLADLLDTFQIAMLGRLLTLGLLAWSLAVLARTLRFPPWSAVAGFAFWVLWRQSLAACGKPIEGFQPKSFAYPMIFFSLAFAIRGQMVRAGAAAGIGTAFHIIVGGWACLALFVGMLTSRSRFPVRQLGVFLLATAPFIAPLLLVVAFFHSGGLSSGEQALMDEIYVEFSQPVCCDPVFFMTDERWARALIVLPVSLLATFLWRGGPAPRLLGSFVSVLIATWLLGLLASWLELDWFLKLYPFQLANSLPALFLLVIGLAWAAGGPRGRYRIARIAGVLTLVWMADERDVLSERLVDVPTRFATSLERAERGRYEDEVSRDEYDAYTWIRENTPEGSVFVTPHLPAFWSYTERAQVASFRHPPHDRGLIEWRERLEALNGFRAFEKRGAKVSKELQRNQPRLTVAELMRIRSLYGATHYLTIGRRRELSAHQLYSNDIYSLYDLGELGGVR